jgi:hypothetical protein
MYIRTHCYPSTHANSLTHDVRADGTVLVTWYDNDRRDRIKPLTEIRKIRVVFTGGSEHNGYCPWCVN